MMAGFGDAGSGMMHSAVAVVLSGTTASNAGPPGNWQRNVPCARTAPVEILMLAHPCVIFGSKLDRTMLVVPFAGIVNW
jgi:hypothetical protein